MFTIPTDLNVGITVKDGITAPGAPEGWLTSGYAKMNSDAESGPPSHYVELRDGYGSLMDWTVNDDYIILHQQEQPVGNYIVETRDWDGTSYDVLICPDGHIVAQQPIEFFAYPEGAFIETVDHDGPTLQKLADQLNTYRQP